MERVSYKVNFITITLHRDTINQRRLEFICVDYDCMTILNEKVCEYI